MVWFWFGFPFEYFGLEFVSQDNVKQSRISEWNWFFWWRVLFAIGKLLFFLPFLHQGISPWGICLLFSSVSPSFCMPVSPAPYSELFRKAVFVLSRSWPLASFPPSLYTLFSPRHFSMTSRSLSFWLCSFHTTFMLLANLLGCWGILWSYFSSRHLYPYYFSYC